MKSLYLSTILLFFANSVNSQNLIGKKVTEIAKKYTTHHIFKSDTAALKRVILFLESSPDNNYTYAYCDASGTIKIQLDTAYTFTYASWGIDTTFTKSTSAFSEGMAAIVSKDDGSIGYIDMTGAVVIKPQYSYAGSFSQGLAYVANIETCGGGETRPNKVGYIDKQNNKVIDLPPYLAELYACCFFMGEEFRNGVAMMYIREAGWDCNCSVTIIIDKTGKVLNYSGELYDVNYNPVEIIR
jgi:hypothetical protein